MANDKHIIDAAVSGGVRALSYHVVLTYVIPIGVPIFVAALGYFTKIPWFWIAVGGLASFSFVTTGLLRFDEWRQGRNVRDKISFKSIRVATNLNGDGVSLGFVLTNIANFPIEFEVIEIRTRISDRVTSQHYSGLRKFSIPANGDGWYNDGIINIDLPTSSEVVEGVIEYKVKYGRNGELKYELSQIKKVSLVYKSGVLETFSWHDAE